MSVTPATGALVGDPTAYKRRPTVMTGWPRCCAPTGRDAWRAGACGNSYGICDWWLYLMRGAHGTPARIPTTRYDTAHRLPRTATTTTAHMPHHTTYALPLPLLPPHHLRLCPYPPNLPPRTFTPYMHCTPHTCDIYTRCHHFPAPTPATCQHPPARTTAFSLEHTVLIHPCRWTVNKRRLQ